MAKYEFTVRIGLPNGRELWNDFAFDSANETIREGWAGLLDAAMADVDQQASGASDAADDKPWEKHGVRFEKPVLRKPEARG